MHNATIKTQNLSLKNFDVRKTECLLLSNNKLAINSPSISQKLLTLLVMSTEKISVGSTCFLCKSFVKILGKGFILRDCLTPFFPPA